MFDSEEIVGKEIKRFHNKEQEYWGPIDHHFSDAFLSMTYDMLCSYFSGEEKRLSMAVFSTVTELVQNIVEHAGTGGWVAVQTYKWQQRLGGRPRRRPRSHQSWTVPSASRLYGR